MGYSPNTIKELRADADGLTVEIGKLDREIAEKQALRTAKIDRRTRILGILEQENAAPELQLSGDVPAPLIDKDSLVASILITLKNSSTPLKAAAVAEKIAKAGFTSHGKTPLSTRVHTELFRLVKREVAVKTPNGYMARATN